MNEFEITNEKLFLALSPDEQMDILINRKGQRCHIEFRYCQEGICYNCEIWRIAELTRTEIKSDE